MLNVNFFILHGCIVSLSPKGWRLVNNWKHILYFDIQNDEIGLIDIPQTQST